MLLLSIDSKRPKERRYQTTEQSHQPGLRVVPHRAVERRLLHPNRLRSLLQRPWSERPQLRSELSLADSGCCLRELLDPLGTGDAPPPACEHSRDSGLLARAETVQSPRQQQNLRKRAES